MASAVQRTVSTTTSDEGEKIIDFSPERLRAPFVLRCAALCIDYMILIAFPAIWLASGKLLGEGNSITIGSTVWGIGIFIFLLNFLVIPLFRGQTIGKMLTGLTILKMDGTRVGLGGIFVRNVIGFLITVLTGGLGFLISAVNSSGRSLQDIIGGTVVIHGRKRQV
jgi:uncharacterized RDD family membrane protein YckC